MSIVFRTLEAEEIDVRVQSVTEKGVILLLYKDARSDMNILDEAVGITNWKREHCVINGNLFCTVSVWDEEKGQWISKQDVGTESNTEQTKGQASDSFKRACVNLGIGRELYTAPFIQIWADKCNIKPGRNGKFTCYDKFAVAKIRYNSKRQITHLAIRNLNTKQLVFTLMPPEEKGGAK